MVESRGQIEQNESNAVDNSADQMPDITVPVGRDKKNGQTYDTETCSYAMRDTVGEFFPQGIFIGLWTLAHEVVEKNFRVNKQRPSLTGCK